MSQTQAITSQTQSLIMARAEPFFFPGGPVGCILIHGYTGTPKEMRWMGEYLAGQGHTVMGVRLSGHATKPEDMKRARWEDWLASVEDAYYMLSGISKHVIVCGLSMGGVLSLVLASRFPVSGVIAMSTPEHLHPGVNIGLIRTLSLVYPFQKKGEANWFDPVAQKEHVSYPVNVTWAFAELRELIKIMRASLPEITAPTLLINSKNDLVVKAEEQHQERIYQALGSLEKQTLWVENSQHVITCDAERQKVFQAAGDFIARIASQPK